jgi:hypothetical protein
MIQSTVPQSILHVEIAEVGPRKKMDVTSKRPFLRGYEGRYGLHFHRCMDGSRGSLVEGVVVRQCGFHAFVPHASHGIAFRNCISHDTFENAWWWDKQSDADTNATNDLLYDGCVASHVSPEQSHRGFTLAAFDMKVGWNMAAINCVAVGVAGNSNASGWIWPENGSGSWRTEGCTSHNHAVNGIYNWQNTSRSHLLAGFILYNSPVGVEHGAYRNGYRFDRLSTLNGRGLVLHATSRGDVTPLRFVDCTFGTTGTEAVSTAKHNLPAGQQTEFHRCRFVGYTSTAVRLGGVNTGDGADLLDFIDCAADDPARFLAPPSATLEAGWRVRVQGQLAAVFIPDAQAVQITAAGVEAIAPFWTAPPIPPAVFDPGVPFAAAAVCEIPA